MCEFKKTSITLLILLLPLTLSAATYRWVDANGKTHYSNSIPPAQSYLGHDELSITGMKKKTVKSEKQNKELQALKEVRREQVALAKIEEKKREKIEEEEIQLLSLYSSEDEIISAYNSKLRRSQLTIDLLKSRHKKQSDLLAILEDQFDKSKVINHRHTLSKQIDNTIDNLSIYQQAITENLVENSRVRKEYRYTLNNFKKLIAKVNLKLNHY